MTLFRGLGVSIDLQKSRMHTFHSSCMYTPQFWLPQRPIFFLNLHMRKIQASPANRSSMLLVLGTRDSVQCTTTIDYALFAIHCDLCPVIYALFTVYYEFYALCTMCCPLGISHHAL